MTEALLALCTTAALLLGSPGPATLTLAAVGATYGFKKGSRFLLGLLGAVVFTISFTMVGIAVVLNTYPPVQIFFQGIGALYIGYLAYKIASAPVIKVNNTDSPESPRFFDGFILNLINPKAYAAFLSLFTQFMLPHENPTTGYILTAVSVYLVVVTVDVAWLAIGGVLRPVFAQPLQARIIRIVFAVLMVASVIYAVIPW